MSWAWRRQARFSKRTLYPLIMSISTFAAFADAGIFSSRVATTRGGEVLVIGNNCAKVSSSLFTAENFGLVQTYLASRIKSSSPYASTCYVNGSSAESCRTFVRST